MNIDKLLPTQELHDEFEEFKMLKTESEKLAFQKKRQEKLQAMTDVERDSYLVASEAGLKNTISEAECFIEKADDSLLREQLVDVLNVISLSYIAERYFGRSRGWLYQRINGYKIHGKTAVFTSDERKKFIVALQEISTMLTKTSIQLG